MTQLDSETSDPFGYAAVRHAMRVVFNAESSQPQPLAYLPLVEAHRSSEHLPDTPEGRRLALRSLLRKTIDGMRPSWNEPDYLDPAWHAYLILHEQFLRKKAVEALADQMSLSRSAYFRVQREALLELANRLRQRNREVEGAAALRPAADAPPAFAARPAHNLPSSLSSFIGRAAELAQITACLDDSGCRLLSLVGLGGSGKTRLALQLARGRVGLYRDGVFYLSLSDFVTTTESGDQMDALTAHLLRSLQSFFLGVSTLRTVDRTALFDLLRDKQLLLVLDNFDNLLDCSPLLCAMLQAAPQLTILITSRQRLRVEGEWTFEVRGLALPPDDTSPDATNGEALQLFMRSARTVQAGFVLSEEDVENVVAVCRLMDGLPLGIELAAAWTRALTCAQIRAQLTSDLSFLTSVQRDAPPQQRSIRIIMDYSWSILEPAEQVVFSEMSVFQGGFNLVAAQQVAEATPALLACLVDKSLLLRTREGRYSLHPLLRQYASERLRADAGREAAVRERHSRYYIAYLDQYRQDLQGSEAPRALRAIEAELENIRAAWQRATYNADASALSAGQDALADYYDITGLIGEGERVFGLAADSLSGRLLANVEERVGVQEVLAGILAHQGYFLQVLAQLDKLLGVAGEGVAVAQALNLPDITARCELSLGMGYLWKDDLSQARGYLEKARSLAQDVGDDRTVAQALLGLAQIANRQVESEAAISYAEQALRIERSLGRLRGTGLALLILGIAEGGADNYEAGSACFAQALEIGRAVGDARMRARALGNLGTNQLALGQGLEAQDSFQQALHILARAGDRRAQATYLLNLGRTALLQGDFVVARGWVEQGLEIVRTTGGLTNTLTHLTIVYGHTLLGLKDLEAAKLAYEQALQLAGTLQQPFAACIAHGGLAQVALRRRSSAAALYHVEAVLNQMVLADPDRFLDGVMDPFQLLLACYQVLHSLGDPRANALLAVAHRRLLARAANIADEDLRRSFLENVPTHRQLLKAYGEGLAVPHPA